MATQEVKKKNTPSEKKSHLGFKIDQRIRIKQEGPVPFRVFRGYSFYFPAGVDIIEHGGSHYVLGVSPPKEVKNPIVRTTIVRFYKNGKALVKYHTTRNSFFSHSGVVDLSNYESCSHLEWDSEKGLGKSFAKYLETSGLTEKIKFKDKFGFGVGDPIYLKSHEKIILDNPTIGEDEFEHALGKDLYYMESFYVTSDRIISNGWKVFGFVGDKVLVEYSGSTEFSHFELFSPEEIGLIIDLDYRLKKEKYFDRLIYSHNVFRGSYIDGIKKIK